MFSRELLRIELVTMVNMVSYHGCECFHSYHDYLDYDVSSFSEGSFCLIFSGLVKCLKYIYRTNLVFTQADW